MVTCAFYRSTFFQMRLGVPRRAGRIGKRVRIPRGRATVKIVAFEATMQKPGDLPGRSCSFRTPRARVFRPPWEFSSQKRSRRQPVACVWQKGVTGFCLFRVGVNNLPLRVISVVLCASVVNLPREMITTEAQRATEDTQRKTLIEDSLARSWSY